MKNAVTKGIIQGDSIGDLMPEKVVTNAEYLTMLSNAYGCRPNILDTEDLPREDWKSHWAKHVIKYAYVQGWINDDFNPDEIITREAAAYYLWESYTRQSVISSGVKDSMKLIEYSKDEVWLPKISQWKIDSLFEDKNQINANYEEAIFQLFVNGIYNGYYTDIFGELNLGPKKALNRAEACAFILRMYEVN